MCFYLLKACPYPHEDSISPLIFDPKKKREWHHCDKRMPWGPLSCGSLTVHHPCHDTSALPIKQRENEFVMKVNHAQIKRGENSSEEDNSTNSESMTNSTSITNSSVSTPCTHACPWCSATIKYVSTMSREVRGTATQAMQRVDNRIKKDPEISHLHEEIRVMEQALDAKRGEAWSRLIAVWEGQSLEEQPDSEPADC